MTAVELENVTTKPTKIAVKLELDADIRGRWKSRENMQKMLKTRKPRRAVAERGKTCIGCQAQEKLHE